jgi:hypothetical protein
VIDWLLDQVPAHLLNFVAASINALWALLSQTVFITPDVTVLPQVRTISARSLAIVNVSFVLVITIAGVIEMTRDTIQSRYGIAELGPRLVVGFVAANFATPICRTVIEFANALPAHRLRVHWLPRRCLAGCRRGARPVALTSAAHAGRVALIWPVRAGRRSVSGSLLDLGERRDLALRRDGEDAAVGLDDGRERRRVADGGRAELLEQAPGQHGVVTGERRLLGGGGELLGAVDGLGELRDLAGQAAPLVEALLLRGVQ